MRNRPHATGFSPSPEHWEFNMALVLCVLVLCQSEVLGLRCATCSDLAVPFDRRAGYWQKVDWGLCGTISQVCSLAVCLWVWMWMWMSVPAIQTYHLLFGALWVFQTYGPELSVSPHDLNTWRMKKSMQDFSGSCYSTCMCLGLGLCFNTFNKGISHLLDRRIKTQHGLMGLILYQTLWRVKWTEKSMSVTFDLINYRTCKMCYPAS